MDRKKIILLALSLFFVNIYCFSFQNKSGTISTAETWSDTIHIVGDISITQNGSVTIAPGTYIELQGLFSINIDQNGKISAIGNVSSPISFVSQNTLSFWNGINFDAMSETADSSKFEFCTFKHCIGALSIINFNKIQINECLFSHNNGSYLNDITYGGAIYCFSSTINISNSVFEHQTASYGGALYFYNSSVTISKSRLTANKADISGGGIFCENSFLKIIKCSIDSNICGATNSASIESLASNVTINNCKIINNKCIGIYAHQTGGTLKIVNCVIANNQSHAVGGIHCLRTSTNIINSTIVNNRATTSGFITSGNESYPETAGGVFFKECSNSKISNSILWNNFGYYNDFSFIDCTPTIQNCDIANGNTVNILEALYINNISLDPKFTDPSNEIGFSTTQIQTNWDLSGCSPCINKGNNSLFDTIPLTDINSNYRVYNDTIDIGAYESQKEQANLNGTKIVYVKENGTGDGSTWTNATGNLQFAINQPIECYENIEVWVASGTYYPDTTGLTYARNASFRLRNNVKVYGGFAGNEITLDQRNWDLNKTVLSGDIGIRGVTSDNSCHVVIIKYLQSSCVLDGITITDGNANISYYDLNDNKGAGIFCTFSNPKLSNLNITNNNSSNYGAGFYGYCSKPSINNLSIYNNNFGGGIYLSYSNANITNTKIINNTNGFYAGLSLFNSDPIIINSIIANNQNYNGTGSGGGVYCWQSKPIFINSIIANNKNNGSNYAGGINCESSSKPEIYNSIIWNNKNHSNEINNIDISGSFSSPSNYIIKSSLIQGGNNLGISSDQYIDNFDLQPHFVAPTITIGTDSTAIFANWSLGGCSPCINRGNNQFFPNSFNSDLASNNRVFDTTIDVGPYEFEEEQRCLSIKFVIVNGSTPAMYHHISLLGNYTQEGDTDHEGECIFYNNSAGVKFRYNITYFNNFVLSDSITNLENDTIIYVQLYGNQIYVNNPDLKCNIYPNPATDKIYIETKNVPDEIKIIIYDINGKELFNQSLNGKLNQIDIHKFPKGIYFVKLINDTIVETHKIIKA